MSTAAEEKSKKDKEKEDAKKEKQKAKEEKAKEKAREKEEKAKEKEVKKQNRKSVQIPVPVATTPRPTTTTVLKPQNPGYSKDLDLEEKIFKPLIASKQQKEDLCFYLIMRMVLPNKARTGKYAFFDRDSSIPAFVLFTTKNLYILDAANMQLQQTLPVTEIREVIVEVTENGLVTLELTNNSHMYFLTSPDAVILNDIMESFHRGAKLAQDSRPQPPFFVSQRTTFVQSYIERSHMNQFVVNKIVSDIEELGFTDQDMWYGTVDMRPWVKKYVAFAKSDPTQSYVIEFVLPGGAKTYFKFVEHVTIKKVIQTVSVGAKLTADKLSLAPVNGCEMLEEETLGNYGLGILFDTWQLLLVDKGSRRQYDVSIELPDTAEFQSFGSPVYKTRFSAHMTGKEAVEAVCLAARVTRPHRFGLTFVITAKKPTNNSIDDDDTVGGVVESNHSLSSHGLCSKHTAMRLVYQYFPVASGDKVRDAKVVRSVVQDIIEDSLIIIRERKKHQMGLYLRELVKGLADQMVDERRKAKTVTTRVAALNPQSKVLFYRMLDEFEQEEVSVFGMPGQRRLMERARDFIWTNLPPAPPITSAPKKPPAPPKIPVAPIMPLKKSTTYTQVTETVNSDGTVTKLERVVTIGGGWGGPPGTNDLLGARARLRPVATRDGGWDKTNVHIGIDFRKVISGQTAAPRFEVPMEAVELYLKLRRRQEAIEKAMMAQGDVEDLGD